MCEGTTDRRQLKVAITGGIGSGKSFVCKRLQRHGIDIYDCDAAAKRLMRTSAPLQQALREAVGEEVCRDGQLNKAHLAQFLLASEHNAQVIDHLVHPAVAHDFIASGYSWMECAILFESGFDRLVDVVVCVDAPHDVRLHRVMERDAITAEKAEAWIQRQWPAERVRQHSDYIIINDGRADIDAQIEQLLQALKNITKKS